MSVFNFGSINIDHVYQVPHLVQPGETLSSKTYQSVLGGKGANQSIALAKAGVNVYHVGAIGASDLSFVDVMKAYGVNCNHVRPLADVASGHAIIQVDDNAENAILLFGGANQAISEDQIALALANANQDDYVLIQNETNALKSIIEHAKQKDMRVIFNPAPMHESVKNLPLSMIDLLIVNEVEAQQLTGYQHLSDIKSGLLSQYPDAKFVMTLGKNGACYLDKDTDTQVDAYAVEAVDTTAAGDTFIGFFMAGLEHQKSIADALRFACAASALAVMTHGASPSIPSIEDVEEFLVKQAQR